ncbi:MAG: pyrroloquinoline quinone-dependent dehydrogenase [Parvularculaceae bacterium]
MRIAISTFLAAALLVGAAAADEAGWPAYGGDPGANRYSEAPQITPENVRRLTKAWTFRTGHMSYSKELRRRSKFEATPILAEDKVVLCTPFNVVIALDPGTGEEIWRHDPKIDLEQEPANQYNCRGVAYWRDPAAERDAPCAARILAGTNDYRLVAIDLDDGARCDAFGQAGEVKVDPEFDLAWPGEFQITSPPVVIGDTVIVGSAIGDNVSVAAPRGTVRAFDVRSGAPRWSFDPIPRNASSAAAQGWDGAEIPTEGHANVWAPMSADLGRGLVFLPTSSPSPDFFGGARRGDNRHANSVVALDAATGAVRWAFQTVHHDVWDYDVPSAPVLATIRKDGAMRDVVIAATKTGLVFTLDRDTGEPVFPVEERPVPQGGAAGETLSPTQPFPVKPAPLAPTEIAQEDAWGLTPFDRGACGKAIAAARAEGLYAPPSEQGTILYPFTGGGANWGGGAFDPSTNIYYVNTSSMMHLITLVPRAATDEDWHGIQNGEQAPMRGAPYAMRRQTMLSPMGLPCNPPPWGLLHAIDMGSGEILWQSVLGTTEELAPLGLALKIGTPNLGGPLATKGGVLFIGAAMDSYLRAFNSATGAELWSSKLPAGGQAGPMSYEWKGRQFVVIAAGGHSDIGAKRGDSVVAYALPEAGSSKGASAGFFDKPGRRFAVNIALIGAGLAGLFLGVRRLLRRR